MNSWRPPVFALGPHEQDLDTLIRESRFLRCMNINETEWENHCETTDEIVGCVMKNVKKFANEDFEGLIIKDDSIRFGSSRDGLKVNDALEFDCILLFDIFEMVVSKESARDYTSEEILGMVKLRVKNAEYLIKRFSWIENTEIFTKFANGEYFLNTKNLQEKVFKSLIDKTRKVINDQLHDIHSSYFLRRTSKPPTFDINITLNKEKAITVLRDDIRSVQGMHVTIKSNKKQSLDIDFVPAFHLRNDRVPNPHTAHLPHGFGIENMNCQVYAVMKWAHRSTEASSKFDSDCLWRECTSGYEKHILDVCRQNNSKRFLMTACRLLKSYVANQHKTNQIRSVAASQHLKTICFYCVTFLTPSSDHNSLSGLKDALGYFLFFLGLCIESKNLPHYFFGNRWLCTHFPDSSFGHGQKQKNLYSSIKLETFRQASLSYKTMLDDLKGLYTEFNLLDSHPIEQFKEHLCLKTSYRKLPESILETCIPKTIVLLITIAFITICFTHGPYCILFNVMIFLFYVIWVIICVTVDQFINMCWDLFIPQYICLSILVLIITIVYLLSCSFFSFFLLLYALK